MIGKKLKELITQKSIKQIKLAKYLGISPSRLSNYLSDKREPDLEMLAKMAKYLGVDLNYFTDVRFSAGRKEVSYPVIVEEAEMLMESTATYSAGCDVVEIPYTSINSKKSAAKTKVVGFSKMFLADIDSPADSTIMFEVTTGIGGKHFQQGDYIVASLYGTCKLESGAILFETGRNSKIFRYIEDKEGKYLLSDDTKEIKKIEDEKELANYYIVVWVIKKA